VLGPDTEIEIEACDECNNFVNVRAIAKRIRKAGGGMVGLVGVQSNQFPRALDLGREFRALGAQVARESEAAAKRKLADAEAARTAAEGRCQSDVKSQPGFGARLRKWFRPEGQ
jgi:hypothetical protein